MKNRAEMLTRYTDIDNDPRRRLSMLKRETNPVVMTAGEFDALKRVVEYAENTIHHASETRGSVTIVRNIMSRTIVVHYPAKTVEEAVRAQLEAKFRGFQETYPEFYKLIFDNTSPRGIVADDSDPETN